VSALLNQESPNSENQNNMNKRLLSLIPTAAMGLALLAPSARADLTLSGNSTGSFDDLSQPNTIVTNAADGSSALWVSGIPTPPSMEPTMIQFSSQTFTDVTSGQPIDVGLFTIHNGIDNAGSTAATAIFNLGLNITSPAFGPLALSTFTFAIDNTLNGPTMVPDQFGVTFDQPAPVVIDGNLVKFNIVFAPPTTTVPEGASVTRGDIFVTFTPVPEPSTYALWGVLLVGGLIAYRRLGMSKGIAGAV
jgi:hypothetical protein